MIDVKGAESGSQHFETIVSNNTVHRMTFSEQMELDGQLQTPDRDLRSRENTALAMYKVCLSQFKDRYGTALKSVPSSV